MYRAMCLLTCWLLGPAAETVQANKPHKDLPKDAGEHTIARLDQMRNSKGNLHTAEIRRNMQRIMQVGSNSSRQPGSAYCMHL